MAISGKFVADFADFNAAVAGAETKLVSFEAGGNKVTSALQRMETSLSGRKLIQDASLAVQAVENIGGVSKLTEAELQRLGTQASAAAAKMKAMGLEVPPGIQKIVDVSAKLEPSLTLGGKAAGILTSAFGQFTAANLAASAIQSLVAGVGEFVNIGMKLPAVQASFERLTTAARQNSTDMLASMTTGTQGMVANYDLMLSANKAMLLGLPVTSASMGELAKTATVLGRAMGQDATTSLNDLITALGRSSPMILDNLGLTVKVGEANEAYALKLHKSADALTDSEKKMAFYEAAMEAARKKTGELGDQTKTLGEIMGTVWTKAGNAVTSNVAIMNVGIGAALSSGANFKQFMLDVAHYGVGIATSLSNARAQADSLAKSLKNIPVEFQGPIDAMGETIKWIDSLRGAVVALTPQQKIWIDQALALGASESEIAKKVGVSETAIKTYTGAIKQRAVDVKAALEEEAKARKAAIEDEQQAQIAQYDLEQKLAEEGKKHRAAEDAATKKDKEAMNATVLAGFASIQQAQAALSDFMAKDSMSAADYQILQIRRAGDAKIAAFKGTADELVRYSAVIQQTVDTEVNAVTTGADRALTAVTAKAQASMTAIQMAIAQLNANLAIDLTSNAAAQGGLSAGMQTPLNVGSGVYATPAPTAAPLNTGRQLAVVQPRAGGGAVAAGEPYWVGEKGPELYTPGSNGFISPHGAGGGVVIHNVFQVVDTESNIVRRVSDKITRQVMQGTKV